MAEPFKNVFNREFVDSLSRELSIVYPSFNSHEFIISVLSEDWEERELKDRMNHISQLLGRYLPTDFEEAIKILKSVSVHFNGLAHMIFPAFVEIYGMDQFEISVDALENFTCLSSSEFSVRPFIVKYPDKMMSQMYHWAESDNHHIRRLASEGCRPRLPWAMALPAFKKDPSPILPILEKLKNDESEYVRRSVANNLNDIAKDHKELVKAIAQEWIGKSKNTDKLIKHGCRTLLKQGDSEMLSLFGFTNPDHIKLKDLEVQKSVQMEESLTFSFVLVTEEAKLGKVRLEYAVGFMKKNGKRQIKSLKYQKQKYIAYQKP